MAIRRFCDICDTLITGDDDKPYIRYHPDRDVKISMIITDERGSVVNDICNSCKQLIILDGFTPEERAEKPLDPNMVVAASTVSHIPKINDRKPGVGSSGSQPVRELESIYVPSLTEKKKEISTPVAEPEQSSQPHPEGEPG